MLEKKLSSKTPLKILIPTDLSLPPHSIIATLSRITKMISFEVNLLHVVPPFWQRLFKSDNEVKESTTLKLLNWGVKLPKGKKPCQIFLAEGNIAKEIASKAKQLNIDLICFEEKKIANIYSNETSAITQQVVRYSNKSVWICKNTKFTSILCAVDGSRSSQNALNSAIQLCKLFSCKLTILNVLPKIDFNPSGLDEHIVRKLEIDFNKKCIKEIDTFLKRFDLDALKGTKIISMIGSPASTILMMAENKNFDLIVMGAKGNNLLHDIFVGSTVEKVMPFTPCSLLIVR
jgi:nucleotide-binding universal stress UspA family protein